MPFVVEPLQESDLYEWTIVHFHAFYPVLACLWESPPSQKGFEMIAVGRKTRFHTPNSHVFKCIDTTTGKIAGVAEWVVYEKQRTPEEVEKTLGESPESPEMNAETHMNPVARDTFMNNIWGARRDVLGGQKAVVLELLTTHPDYQRQGVGKALMKWGVDEADRLGFIAYLESSEGGKGLYERFGFKPVKELYFDSRPFGGHGIVTNTVMIRQPVPKTEN